MEAMESGLVVDPNTSVEPEGATVDDPWAIVELVDDSKPWSDKEPIYHSSVDFFMFLTFVQCLFRNGDQ